MNCFPLGEVKEDRYKLSEKYGLLEKVNGVHRLTKKCRENYDAMSYIYYLQGKTQRPERISPEVVYQRTLNELLSL